MNKNEIIIRTVEELETLADLAEYRKIIVDAEEVDVRREILRRISDSTCGTATQHTPLPIDGEVYNFDDVM